MSKSSRGILERLSDHLNRVSTELSGKIQEASESHAGTPESVADARERSLRNIISRFFPAPYNVTKGAIYDTYGERSASIDCVICAPNHPFLIGVDGNIEILLIDGVFAAIELKPVLTDLPDDFGEERKQQPEIVRGLEQARSVKRLKRTKSALLRGPVGGNPSEASQDYAFRCPTYIVADTSAPIAILAQYIGDYYVTYAIPIEEQVDVVFVLREGLAMISKAPDIFIRYATDKEWRPHIAAYPPSPSTTSLFFTRLVSEIGPEMNMSEPVLKRYLKKLPRPRPAAVSPTVAAEASSLPMKQTTSPQGR